MFKSFLPLAILMSTGAVAQTIVVDGEVFRDPTQPPSMVAAVVSVDTAGPAVDVASRVNLVVSFVRAGGSQPVAIINNTVLTVGESIEGALVRDIQPGQVVMALEGQEFVLSTFGRSVRTSAN